MKKKWKASFDAITKKTLQRKEKFCNSSGIEIAPLYTKEDLPKTNDVEIPGKFPFTRGPYETMYRTKLWTMRQFAGFGSAEDTNKRFKYLLKEGQTGLSTAFDLPTLLGYDSDDPKSLGEVGKTGVAISSLKDMEILFDGIPLKEVSISMTVNGSAAIIWAFFLAMAKKRKIPLSALRGTIQNDILKEYIAQKTYIFPPEPSIRLILDMFEYGTKYVPQWHPISISGYHIREAGSTAVQELAYTLMDGLEYVDQALKRGLKIDDFGPRLSFFFNMHNNFFEEIAKVRAARRIWAMEMKKRGAKNPKTLALRTHAQTAGCTLTAQQVENNVVRVAIQALAATLAGCQSLHTNSKDEALALPTENSVTTALRTQQILAYETGVADVADPLGGSYYVEWLTNKMVDEAYRIFNEIKTQGGVLKCIENGYYHHQIGKSSFEFQKDVDAGKEIIVGVNKFAIKEDIQIPLLKVDQKVLKIQISRLNQVRKGRNKKKVEHALSALKNAALGKENLIPFLISAAENYVTLGEIRSTLVEVFGEHKESTVF